MVKAGPFDHVESMSMSIELWPSKTEEPGSIETQWTCTIKEMRGTVMLGQ